MKERPILFSGEMVRAILDGRKTQTRRPMKPQPDPRFCDPIWQYGSDWVPNQCVNADLRGAPSRFQCPFGQPGDRLWVRETWRMDPWNIAAEYRATTSALLEHIAPWRPSIHMPRWASRITLEIVRVSIERVQDITEEGANAEGCVDGGCLACGKREPCRCATSRFSRRDSFAELWRSIYGTWSANPWVWVVEFRRVQP